MSLKWWGNNIQKIYFCKTGAEKETLSDDYDIFIGNIWNIWNNVNVKDKNTR